MVKNFEAEGLIQITGRFNYTEISEELNIDFINNPELLEQPEWATKSACWWWNKRKLNNIADQWNPTNNNDINFRRITKIINGGYNGYKDRKAHYDLALKNIKIMMELDYKRWLQQGQMSGTNPTIGNSIDFFQSNITK